MAVPDRTDLPPPPTDRCSRLVPEHPLAGLSMSGGTPPTARLQQWERRAEWPLAVAALVVLVTYAWPILQPGLPAWERQVCEGVEWATWGVFVVDYVVRVRWAPDRLGYVRGHWLDLAVVALPVLRPLRLLRLVSMLGVLNRAAAGGDRFRGRVGVYTASATVLLLVVSSLSLLDAERGQPGATIQTYPEALWWSLATVTTVGYGDFTPVTWHGRAVAALLMVCGIALIGVVTGWVASWIVERVSEVQDEQRAATRADLARLTDEVSALRAELAAAGLRPEPVASPQEDTPVHAPDQR